jgi:hypothetical protein
VSRAADRFRNDLRYRDEADPRQAHLTPRYILEPIRWLMDGIELDPCTEPDNPTGASRFYAPPVDGATQSWDARSIFVNPPYGKAKDRWVRRCIEAGSQGRAVVLLIPAHPDTRVFQDALATATSVLFIRGRVKFGVLRLNRRQAAASHPSALIGWNVDLTQIKGLGYSLALALDVERLAEALWNTCSSKAHAEHGRGECDTCDWYRTLANGDAEAIAREYDALATRWRVSELLDKETG